MINILRHNVPWQNTRGTYIPRLVATDLAEGAAVGGAFALNSVNQRLNKKRFRSGRLKYLRGTNPATVPAKSGGRMALFTYRRQFNSRRNKRSRKTVRRLAKAQTNNRLKGSSSNTISATQTIPIPAPVGTAPAAAEGDSAFLLYVPALAPICKFTYKRRTPGTAFESGQTFTKLLYRRHSLAITPDWPVHTVDAIAFTYEITFFSLKNKTLLSDVVVTPGFSADPEPAGYLNSMTTFQTTNTQNVAGLIADYFAGINQRQDNDNSAAASQANKNRFLNRRFNYFDSPNLMAQIQYRSTKTLYIPYGQSATYEFTTRGQNISYKDLEIPFDYVDPTGTGTDNTNTPYLPAGWPIIFIRVWKHQSDASISTTRPEAKDALGLTTRMFYKIPGTYGRGIDGIDTNEAPSPYVELGTAAGTWTDGYT